MHESRRMRPPAVTSDVTKVTVYREGALVTREATLVPTDGRFPEEVRLSNLPLTLDESSIRARVESLESGTQLPEATDLRVVLELPEVDEHLPPAEDEELWEARRQEAYLSEQLEHLDQRFRDCLGKLEIPPRPTGKWDTPPPLPSPTEARLALLSFRDEYVEDLIRRRQAVEKAHVPARERLRHLEGLWK